MYRLKTELPSNFEETHVSFVMEKGSETDVALNDYGGMVNAARRGRCFHGPLKFLSEYLHVVGRSLFNTAIYEHNNRLILC